MNDWSEFWAFRKFLTPVFIQVIFWVGVVVIVIGALITMFRVNFFVGLAYLIIAPFFWRIYCELLILLFRIYDELMAIRTGRPPEAPGFPVIQPPPPTPIVPPPAPGV